MPRPKLIEPDERRKHEKQLRQDAEKFAREAEAAVSQSLEGYSLKPAVGDAATELGEVWDQMMALLSEEHEAAQKEHALQKKRDKNLKVKMPKSPTVIKPRSDRERPWAEPPSPGATTDAFGRPLTPRVHPCFDTLTEMLNLDAHTELRLYEPGSAISVAAAVGAVASVDPSAVAALAAAEAAAISPRASAAVHLSARPAVVREALAQFGRDKSPRAVQKNGIPRTPRGPGMRPATAKPAAEGAGGGLMASVGACDGALSSSVVHRKVGPNRGPNRAGRPPPTSYVLDKRAATAGMIGSARRSAAAQNKQLQSEAVAMRISSFRALQPPQVVALPIDAERGLLSSRGGNRCGCGAIKAAMESSQRPATAATRSSFVDSWAASPRPSTANLAGSPAITHTILPHPPGTIPPPPPREPPPSKDQTKGMYALPTSMDLGAAASRGGNPFFPVGPRVRKKWAL